MNKKKKIHPHIGRLRLVMSGVFFIALILIAKLYQVQIVQHEEFAERADRQYVRPINSSIDRGSIFFSTKDGDKLAAATIKSGYTLAVNSTIFKKADERYESFAEIIPDFDREEYLRKTAKDDIYEELAKRLTVEQKDAVLALDYDGIALYKDRWRYYPGDELASQVLGFISYLDGEVKGHYGLEMAYQDVLVRNTTDVYVNFFVEMFSGAKKVLTDGNKKAGSIVTTIEPSVELMLEDVIARTNDKWNSKITGGIIMNPKNGEIYAMAATPGFNANDFGSAESLDVLQNPHVERVYEMGSVVKPITMAIGLDTGAVRPETTYLDTGSRTINNRTFFNYDKKARGRVDMQTVLSSSLNTGVSFVVDEVGIPTFKKYMLEFFGDKTGIDLPREQAPLVNNLEGGKDIEYATASFGQGIALSPISLIRGLAALGNGGYLVTPHVVKEIEYTIGTSKVIEVDNSKRVFSEKTSEDISRMLVNVVDDALLGGTVALPNHTVAAKTGTAQIVGDDGKYSEDLFLHSFFGYFPAFDPEFIVLLYTTEPKDVLYASETLTAPFFELTDFLIAYYEIEPDR